MSVSESAGTASDVPVVVITGCSSGIGRATACLFARRGYRVFATMRRPADATDLREEAVRAGWRLATPALDVTSDAQVAEVIAAILEETGGRVDVLVNNAGYYVYGAIEETRPEELFAQLDTNLVGVLRLCRAVLPAMRARQAGTIVNLSSTSGRTALPIVGAYQISKFALEALTETLRYEAIPFGIRVVCVEPGPFATRLHDKQVATLESQRPDSPYRALVATYKDRLARLPRASLDGAAEAIFAAATAARPGLRRPVGPLSWWATVARSLTPDRLFEWLVRVVFRLREP